MSKIPYGRQNISEEDIKAVVEVLKSDFLTQGPVVPEFEKIVSKYCGAAYGIAVNSATSALHTACLALGVGPGDLVWTTPITFVASANCVRYCGADVDFVDIDPRTYNLSVECLAEKLQQAKTAGRLPKVVIPVHLAGQSCDMHGIAALAKQFNFKIIEDASHAIGASYRGEKVGSCRYSDITIFSFHPVKIITTAEGGVAVTNDPALAKQMARLRSHGITRSPEEMTHAPDGSWYYQQIELGFNYRMTEMQAALGVSQMTRLDQFVAQRHELVNRYDQLLEGSAVITPWQDPEAYSSHHLYVVRVLGGVNGPSHSETFENLRSGGVGVNLHYIPVYRHPYYEKMGFKRADFPEAESYYKQAISLPLFPGLAKQEQNEVVHLLKGSVGYQTIF